MSRILVAEDDPHILRLISLRLRRHGHDVLEARNGLAALELTTAQIVDVLVSDVNMPGMNGLELVETVLRDGRVRRGIIVLTNRWDHSDIRERLSEPGRPRPGSWPEKGVYVLPKPFSPTGLSELVNSLVAAGAAEPHQVGQSSSFAPADVGGTGQ
jgi:CheY-like chemotaxis protein